VKLGSTDGGGDEQAAVVRGIEVGVVLGANEPVQSLAPEPFDHREM